MDEKAVGFIGWLVIIWLGLWHFDVNPFSNEVTVYSQEFKCQDEVYKTGCSWESVVYETYEVNPEAQSVIFWTSNKPWPLVALNDCIVVSKARWSCGGELYQFGFNDGEYTVKNSETFRSVSKTWWWLMKLKSL
jgi:hypothetical protein